MCVRACVCEADCWTGGGVASPPWRTEQQRGPNRARKRATIRVSSSGGARILACLRLRLALMGLSRFPLGRPGRARPRGWRDGTGWAVMRLLVQRVLVDADVMGPN